MRRPRYRAGNACAASSITASPRARATSWVACRSGGRPAYCTGRTALVLAVSAASSPLGSRFNVSGATSTRTGRAPVCSMTLTDAAKVIGVGMTSSTGPMPRGARAGGSAAGQEWSPSAPGAPTYAANSLSNRRVLGPVVIQSERSVSTTSSISSCPTRGGAKGRNVARRRRAAAGVGGGAGAVTAIPAEPRCSGKALMACPRPTVATRVDERRDDQGGGGGRGDRRDRVVALVLRHEHGERAHDVLMIAQGRHREQLSQIASQRRAVAVVPLDQADLVHRRGHGALPGGDELLAQLLAGPQAHELDVDVLVGDEAGEPDQLLGQVQDPDLPAHFQNGDALRRFGDRGGRQHQLHRLGNGHEVALHFGVRDGEGSARRSEEHTSEHTSE